jgi:hypothetical protein
MPATKQKKHTPIDADQLRQKLKLKHYETTSKFREAHSEAHRHLQEKGVDLERIRQHSAKLIGAGTMAGALLLSAPDTTKLLPKPHDIGGHTITAHSGLPAMSPRAVLMEGLKELLPENPRPLTAQEEKYLEKLFERTLGVKAVATLEGEHLNTTYGYIGAEQHLVRYPGDVNANHAPDPDEYGGDNPQEILKEGIAPGKGAWGYFAPSKEAMTEDLEETERWYAVVQTLYLPDWNYRQPHLKNWYKYRKVLILNTDNGKAVVAAIADSGPAAWTGKHFGGSPEVMDYLGGPRYKKGPVVLFFVDDPENKVPLGPVNYNQVETQAGLIEI